ncbi:MAG: hypothetical protein ABIO70_33130 [Pseudomonadota bacterium]
MSERDTILTGWWTRDEAQVAVAALVAAGLPAPSSHSEPSAWCLETVEDLLNAWILHEESRAALTAECNRRIKDVTLVAKRGRATRVIFGPREKHGPSPRISALGVGSVPLENLSVGRLTAWIDARLAHPTGGAPRTVRGDVKVLKAAYTWGQRDYAALRSLAPFPPVHELIRVRKGWVTSRTTPPDHDAEAVLAQLEGGARLGVELWGVTGARRSEIALLRAEQVLQDDMIEVAGKTGPRLTAVPPEIHAVLVEKARSREPGDYLLDGCTWADRAGWLGACLRRACQKAGVTPFTSNGLRRAMVRRLRRHGVPDEVRFAMLGNTADVSRDHYDEVADFEKRAAVQKARVGVRKGAGSAVIEGPWVQERAQKTGTTDDYGV